MILAATGFLSTTSYNALQYLALTTSSPINIALITAAGPIFTLLMGRSLFQAPISRAATLGAVVSMLGVAWVLIRGDVLNAARISFVPGDLFMLLAIALWALYTWLLRSRPAEMSGYSILTMQMAWGLLFAVPMVLAELVWGGYDAIEWSPKIYGMVVYVALGPALLAYLCWNHGVRVVGAAKAALSNYLMPVFTAILGWLLLGEGLQLFHWVGGALIFAGLLLGTQRAAAR